MPPIRASRFRDTGRLDALLPNAVARGALPFGVAMVASAGQVEWHDAVGEASDGSPATLDTLFCLRSMTKAVGSLAAMILVDRGQLDLSSAVVDLVPEFADVRVLDSMTPQGPRMREPRAPVTVRHLLTHTAGFAYSAFEAKLLEYEVATQMATVEDGTVESLKYPLMFDPGERFCYGISTDWLGLVVERVGGSKLDDFCRDEIFEPAGMRSTVFELDGQEKADLADLRVRAADGSFELLDWKPPPHPEIYGMGGCLYATAPDYIRFLQMFLRDGRAASGQRILSTNTFRLMTENQIGALRVGAFAATGPLSAPVDFASGIAKTWTTAFMRTEEDLPGRRASGSLSWSGFCNTHFWVDRASDVAAVFMTQTLPWCEPEFMKSFDEFECAVYSAILPARRSRRLGSASAAQQH